MKYFIYSDGAVSKNGTKNAKGGWGAILLREDTQNPNDFDNHYSLTASGGVLNTTNQRMELVGAIEGLKLLSELKFADEVFLRTDSAYLYNCWKNEWFKAWERNGWKNSKKEPVANKDLWEILLPYFKNSQITIQKVKGHSGDLYNELVDQLAVDAREKLL